MPPSTGRSNNNNNGHANHSMSSTEDGSLKAVTIDASSTTSKPTEQAKKLNLQTGDLTDSSTNTSVTSSCTPSKELVVPLGLEEEGSIDVFSSKSREIPEKEAAPKKSLLGGVTLALMSALSFSITTVIVKYASDIKPSQMALFRYLGVLIFSIPVVNESQASWFGEPNWHWRTFMLVRALSGCTSLFFRYSALAYIGLAETTIIMLALPVMVFIIARIFLGEEFGRYHVLALVLSIVGIAFASNVDIVGLFFSKNVQNHAAVNNTTTWIPEQSSTTKSLYDNVTTFNSSEMTAKTDAEMMSFSTKNLIGSLFAIAAMMVGSLAYIMMRMMRTTHPSVILFNFALISLVEMTIINFAFYDFHLPSTGYSAYLVSILGILSFYGQLLLTKASQLEEAGVVSVVRSSGEAFFAFILQIVCFGEVPDLFTTLGAILVLASVCLLSFRKYIISLPDGSSLKMKFSFLTA